jgi:hypothetical protein
MPALLAAAAKRQKQGHPQGAALQRNIEHLRRVNAASVRAAVVLR